MEYLVPVLAVVVIGALAFAAARWMSAGRARQAADQRTPSGRGLDIGPERARLAAGLLDEDAHRRVYGHIAQSRVMEAVRDYRAHTGRGLKDAVMDVQSLAVHPQVYSEPVQEPDATSAGVAGPVPADHGEPHRDDAAPAETPGPERPGQDSSGQREPDAGAADVITAYPSARPGPAGAIHGVGITVLPDLASRSLPKTVRRLRLTNPNPVRDIVALTAPVARSNEAAKLAVDLLQQIAAASARRR